MMRTQIRLPDELYREVKQMAEERESTLAEIVRRGIEYMVQIYPARDSTPEWHPTRPRSLGPFKVPVDRWREFANEA